MFGKFVGGTGKVAAVEKTANILEAAAINGANLPRAPQSAFRKRPVRLSYDKNEFWAFRLPSENHFLLQNFDKSALFGTRHGLQHSPNIAEQMNIDKRIMLGLVSLTVIMVLADMPRLKKLVNLRDNYRLVDAGRFQADDFVEKKQ